MRQAEDAADEVNEDEKEEEKKAMGDEEIKDQPECNIEETIEDLREEVAQEEKRREKALRHQYKYKETYGAIFYSDVPKRAKTLKGIDGAAIT